MKLIYRGQSYDYNPDGALGNTGRPARSPHVSQAPYTVIYRGQTLRIDPSNTAEVGLPQSYDLIYRGATYRVNRGGVAHTATEQPVVHIPSALPRHYVSKIHNANLQANLDRRLTAAQARGDQELVAMLEAERKQMAV
jgi:hypothetical protein